MLTKAITARLEHLCDAASAIGLLVESAAADLPTLTQAQALVGIDALADQLDSLHDALQAAIGPEGAEDVPDAPGAKAGVPVGLEDIDP